MRKVACNCISVNTIITASVTLNVQYKCTTLYSKEIYITLHIIK